MDKIPPKTRAVYEFLHAYFNTALAKTASEHNEATVSALAKLDNKLDLLSRRIDDVKLSIESTSTSFATTLARTAAPTSRRHQRRCLQGSRSWARTLHSIADLADLMDSGQMQINDTQVPSMYPLQLEV
ncbi:hypothetical protein D1007_45508 [Hordeum vulgare]|nr:hypothetical protein D1007_45508 [Hordeum vulgare]